MFLFFPQAICLRLERRMTASRNRFLFHTVYSRGSIFSVSDLMAVLFDQSPMNHDGGFWLPALPQGSLAGASVLISHSVHL